MAVVVQSLACSQRETYANLQIIVYRFDAPPLDLLAGRRPSVPESYLTALNALVYPDDQSRAVPLRNVLIDHTHLERLVLVQVWANSSLCSLKEKQSKC